MRVVGAPGAAFPTLTIILAAGLVAAALVGCGRDEPMAPDEGPRAIDRELLAAAYENDVAAARRLVDEGADVNAKDRFNGTGLIRASERGNARIVARLLETDIDVDHVNRLGWTALLEAVVLGEGGREHVRTVRLLAEGGADVTIPDESGTTALAHARRQGFTAIERILEEAGAPG